MKANTGSIWEVGEAEVLLEFPPILACEIVVSVKVPDTTRFSLGEVGSFRTPLFLASSNAFSKSILGGSFSEVLGSLNCERVSLKIANRTPPFSV
jgi:hypothetical protein